MNVRTIGIRRNAIRIRRNARRVKKLRKIAPKLVASARKVQVALAFAQPSAVWIKWYAHPWSTIMVARSKPLVQMLQKIVPKCKQNKNTHFI